MPTRPPCNILYIILCIIKLITLFIIHFKANNFNNEFAGNFNPRPVFFGLFGANTPEETKCYRLFSQLKDSVDRILEANQFWDVMPRVSDKPRCKQ